MLTNVDNAHSCGKCSQLWKMLTDLEMLTGLENAHNCRYIMLTDLENAHICG